MTTDRFKSRPEPGTRVQLSTPGPEEPRSRGIVHVVQPDERQRVSVMWDDGHLTTVRCEQLRPQTTDVAPDAVRPLDSNRGEGWYEWHRRPASTTHIAYVYESGRIYHPAADATDEEFVLAAARGDVHKLVRAVSLLGEDAALASRTAEMVEEWEYGWVARFDNGDLYDWGACPSRDFAIRRVELMTKGEAAGVFAQIPEGSLFYSLARRRPEHEAGQWEPVPPTPEEADRA